MMGHKICLFGEIWKIISKLCQLLLLIWSSEFRIRGLIESSKFFENLQDLGTVIV